VTELEAVLGARAAQVAHIEADLAAFQIRYRHEVGLLHEELDELERAIEEAELGELARRVENEPVENTIRILRFACGTTLLLS